MPVELPILRVAQTLAERAAAHPAVSHGVVGPWGSARTAVAFQTARTMQRSALIVASGRIEAEAVYEDLCTFAGPEASALFPAWEVMPGDIMAPSDDIVAERMDTLMRLAEANRDGRPMYVAVSVRALLQAVVKREQFLSHRLTITAGEEYDLEQLLEELIDLGYSRELMVEQRGEMSVRGGILDVFAISGELPYRIEFFGDEVESIRCFEPETQRSVERVESVSILPRSEKAMLASLASSDGAPACLTDYFPDETLVVMDEPLNVLEEAETVERRMAGKPHCLTWRTFQDRVKTCPQVSLAQLAHEAVEGERRITEPMGAVSGWTGEPEGFWRQLDEWEREEYTVILICNNTGERRRLFELLDEHGHNVGRGPFDLRVEVGRLQGGFASATDRLAVLSEREIFGRHYVRRTRRRFEAGAGITAFSDLRGGDYIVHVVHGIGRYEGLRRFPGKGGDFLCIRYAGGDKLYVPAGEIDQVQKYVGGDGGVPRIDRLGGASWARTKKKVKKALHDMTEELIKLYASREAHEGHAFSPDTVWQREFEDAFEYDETVDQARAIEEVKRDMESPRPMDRLLCGDVGYGKTEVALRAAFKAVMDRKQVALLVPTTTALCHVLRAPGRLSCLGERAEPIRVPGQAASDHRTAQVGRGRHRHRHPPADLEGHQIQGSGTAHHRRRAEVWRSTEREDQAPAHQRRRTDDDGHTHSPHTSSVAYGLARHERYQHGSERPPTGAYMHRNLRRRPHQGGH
ncbi:MAG: hypothetical protein GWP08_16325 [Nitrospiraceae bacterium]|nr:hypothetical protein [Nitrospiraceae bacterium]